jgi:streptogramin lyase
VLVQFIFCDWGLILMSYLPAGPNHALRLTALILAASVLGVCPAAHAFVTAADFNGLESRIESSSIDTVLGVAVDVHGNVYIAEGNGVVKETLSPDRNSYAETIVAVTPGLKRAGIAVDDSGNLYLGIGSAVYKETPTDGSYDQTVLTSDVVQPDWIAVDAKGDVYIADNADGRIVKETPAGDKYTQSVVLPKATSGANSLNGLAVDAIGNVYFISEGNVWKSSPTTSGYEAKLALAGTYGRGLAVDGVGDLYVTVGNTQVLHETRLEEKYTQSTLATAHVPVAAGLAVDGSGNLYVGDLSGNRILKEYATTSASPMVSMLAGPSGNNTSH